MVWRETISRLYKSHTPLHEKCEIYSIFLTFSGFVDTTAPQKKVKEAITDELSTIPGVNVTVLPDFSLKVDGFKNEHIEEDVEENSEDEDEEEKPKVKSAKKRKIEKKEKKKITKKKAKKDESSDSEDNDIEEAENEYLKKNQEEIDEEDSNEKNDKEK